METRKEFGPASSQQKRYRHQKIGEFGSAEDRVGGEAPEQARSLYDAFQRISFAVPFTMNGKAEVDQTHCGRAQGGIGALGIPGEKRDIVTTRSQLIGHENEDTLCATTSQAGDMENDTFCHVGY